MYTGNVIEDLIAAVARAEEHARTVKPAEKRCEPVVQMPPVYQQFLYEAPFGASLIGAA